MREHETVVRVERDVFDTTRIHVHLAQIDRASIQPRSQGPLAIWNVFKSKAGGERFARRQLHAMEPRGACA